MQASNFISTTAPQTVGWAAKPDPDRLTHLAHLVRTHTTPITARNFRTWLYDMAFDRIADGAAACPNGDDHPCNRGLGRYLGIEPYGQTGAESDGVYSKQLPWNQQKGYSAERLNRHVDPDWKAAVLAADFTLQRVMYSSLIETLRDTGEFVYSIPKVIATDYDAALDKVNMGTALEEPIGLDNPDIVTKLADRRITEADRATYGSDIVDGLNAG